MTYSEPDGLGGRTVGAGGGRVVCLYAADRWENVVVLDASFDRMATLASKGERQSECDTVTTPLLLDVDENGSPEYAG